MPAPPSPPSASGGCCSLRAARGGGVGRVLEANAAWQGVAGEALRASKRCLHTCWPLTRARARALLGVCVCSMRQAAERQKLAEQMAAEEDAAEAAAGKG